MKSLKVIYLLAVFMLIISFSSTTHIIEGQTRKVAPSIEGTTIIESNANEELTLNWTVTDDDVKSYEIELNGGIVGKGNWDPPSNNDSFTRSDVIQLATILPKGDYVFTLSVSDYSNLTSTFVTTILVTKSEAPNAFLPINIFNIGLALIGIVIVRRIKLSTQ